MALRPERISDVMIILDPKVEGRMDQVLADLKKLGLQVSTVDKDDAMIEGTIDAYHVGELRARDYVDYVRTVFTYTTYVPAGSSGGQ